MKPEHESPRPPLRSVHVGVGGRGLTHVCRFRDHPRWQPVAVVDTDPVALAAAAGSARVATVNCFSDAAEAIAGVEADAAVIVSPSPFHHDHVRLALDAGLHVFVEKPFTQRLVDAIELVALADARRLQVAVCQQYRYGSQELAVRNAIASGLAGNIRYGAMVHHRHRPDVLRFTMAHALITEMSVHHFDTLRSWVGDAAETVTARSFDPPWSRYDGGAASALLSFADGVEIAYLAAFTSSVDDFQVRFECDNGVVGIDADGPYVALAGLRRQLRPVGGRSADEHVIDRFTTAIGDGTDHPVSGRSNLGTMAMVDAAIRSASTGLPATCWPAHDVTLEGV